MDRDNPQTFVGRDRELSWISSLLSSAAGGRGSAAVISGEIGIGKTRTIAAGLDASSGHRAVMVTGVEGETDQPYGLVQRTVMAHPEVLASLPADCQDILLAAAGLRRGAVPPRPLVGLGFRDFLVSAAHGRPLVWVIDDAQWADAASLAAFSFTARRLATEPLVLLFAVRTIEPGPTLLSDLPTRLLTGLGPADAATLLAEAAQRQLDGAVAARLADGTGGNPRALIDLAAELSTAQLTGREPLGDALGEPLPIGKHLQEFYHQPLRQLPPDTQVWLALAAAAGEAGLAAVSAVSSGLGLHPGASLAAETAGLVTLAPRLRFSHPFIRSAAYHSVTGPDRRAAHRHLAEHFACVGDQHRWVTHLALANPGPSEDIARALLDAATMAEGLNAFTRTSLLLTAAALTPLPLRKSERLLGACESAIGAGSVIQARTILDSIDPGLLDDVGRGRLLIAQSELDVVSRPGRPVAAHRAFQLLQAARLLRDRAPERARRAIVEAYWALIQTDDQVQDTSSQQIAEEAQAINRAHPSDGLPARALAALSALVLDGAAQASTLLAEVATAGLGPGASDEELLESAFCISYGAALQHDQVASSEILANAEESARRRGALVDLCRILLLRTALDLRQGHTAPIRDRLTEAASLVDFMGLPAVYSALVTSAPLELVRSGTGVSAADASLDEAAMALGYGRHVATRRVSLMLLRASEGRYVEAWRVGREVRYDDPLFVGALHLPDLIECSVRAGDESTAQELLRLLIRHTGDPATPWAEGLLERSRGLLSDGGADAHFQRALLLLARPGLDLDLARTHLLHGEWLRRRRQRGAAAEHLAEARDTFVRLGAPLWAERARREWATLQPFTGQKNPGPGSPLTVQELAVAAFARDGYTNSEIARQLFVSANTVDYHLRKVFRKLGLTSRRQLQRIELSEQGSRALPN